jgi:hypothetical protein
VTDVANAVSRISTTFPVRRSGANGPGAGADGSGLRVGTPNAVGVRDARAVGVREGIIVEVEGDDDGSSSSIGEKPGLPRTEGRSGEESSSLTPRFFSSGAGV